MKDYVVKKVWGVEGNRLVRFIGPGKIDREWVERSYAEKFTIEEATLLAHQHHAEVVRA